MPTGPLLTIDAPPRTGPPHGLLRSALVQEDETLRFINGETWSADSCSRGVVLDPCSTAATVTATYADAVTTNGSPTLTSATASFRAADVGKTISGAGIPANTTILAVTNATTITLSANATATATGVTITIANRTPGGNRPVNRVANAFVVRKYDTCSTFAFESSDYEGRARRALAANATVLVEQELATGATVVNRHFQDTGANTNTSGIATTPLNSGTDVGARVGLALLVQEIADKNGGMGMIHARPGLVTLWAGLNLLYREGGKLYTFTGNPVVSGAGYTGAAPDGTPATLTDQWAYATDLIQVKRGPVEVFSGAQLDLDEVVDRGNNTITIRAQQAYVLEFNACVLAGVKIDASLDSTTGGFGV